MKANSKKFNPLNLCKRQSITLHILTSIDHQLPGDFNEKEAIELQDNSQRRVAAAMQLETCSTTFIQPLVTQSVVGGPAQETGQENACDDKSVESSEEDQNRPRSPFIHTPSRWILNTPEYLGKVAELIKFTFRSNVNWVHARNFNEKRKRAEGRREWKDRQFWTKADPECDAWMLVFGHVRPCFNIEAFVKSHPVIYPFLQRLRKMVRVQVLNCSCPVAKALQQLAKEDEKSQGRKSDEDGEQEAPQLPSKCYWTTIKKWRPW